MHIYIENNIFSLCNAESYMFEIFVSSSGSSKTCIVHVRQSHKQQAPSQNKQYVCSHIDTTLSQDIIMSHRLYFIIQRRQSDFLSDNFIDL